MRRLLGSGSGVSTTLPRAGAARAALARGDEWSFRDSDLDYVRDLGLIARDPPPRIANPIYAEVVSREITSTAQERLVEDAACRGRGGAM